MIYSEQDLIIPVLSHLLMNKTRGLKTSQLIYLLAKELEITGKDKEIIVGRKDTYFSQKVRNLVSHRTLDKKGLAVYKKIKKDGLHVITEKGEKYLLENINKYAYIVENNFTTKQREDVIDRDYKDLVVEEGFINFTQVRTRQRSKKLIEIAKKHFFKNRKRYCLACKFNFDRFYGKRAKGYIEIHHIKPIFTYEKKIKQSILNALKNVVPVCANCHRMIHRDKNQLLTIMKLKKMIRKNGKYG